MADVRALSRPGLKVPHLDEAIRPGDVAAIESERQESIPGILHPVGTARDKVPTIWRKHHRVDQFVSLLERLQLPAGLYLPQVNGGELVRRSQRPAIRRESDVMRRAMRGGDGPHPRGRSGVPNGDDSGQVTGCEPGSIP